MRREYLVVNIDMSILSSAASLIDRHTLRTLDAIQLACAVDAVKSLREPITFISADNNLLKVATAEGFTVDNPNQHP